MHDTEFWFKVIGGIGALVGFSFGLYRYSESEKWQKMKVLLELLESFKKDGLIQATCFMLDWDERDIDVGDGRHIQFKNEMLVDALRVTYSEQSGSLPMDRTPSLDRESEDKGAFKPDEAAIRDCFDKFFDFFDKLEGFRRNKLIKMSDLTYFNYWFELVHNIGRYKGNESIKRTIDAYVKTYNFQGFQELLKLYSKSPIKLFEREGKTNQPANQP
jgi:hypothetical protein